MSERISDAEVSRRDAIVYGVGALAIEFTAGLKFSEAPEESVVLGVASVAFGVLAWFEHKSSMQQSRDAPNIAGQQGSDTIE